MKLLHCYIPNKLLFLPLGLLEWHFIATSIFFAITSDYNSFLVIFGKLLGWEAVPPAPPCVLWHVGTHPGHGTVPACPRSEGRMQLPRAPGSGAATHRWLSINASVLPISRFLSVTTRSKWVVCSPGSCCNSLWETNPAVWKLPCKQRNRPHWKENWFLTSSSWRERAQQWLCLAPAVDPHRDKFSWLFLAGVKEEVQGSQPSVSRVQLIQSVPQQDGERKTCLWSILVARPVWATAFVQLGVYLLFWQDGDVLIALIHGCSHSCSKPTFVSHLFALLVILLIIVIHCTCNCDKLSLRMRWLLGDSLGAVFRRTQDS